MTYFAEPKKKTAPILTLALFLLAGGCGVTAALGIGWRGVFYLLAVVLLTAAIQIAQRYLLSGFEYILDREDDLPSLNRLTVIRIVGKNRSSVFTLPLLTLREVIPYRKPAALREEYGATAARFDYCADLFPASSFWLLFEADGVQTAVRLQCDGAFADELKKRAGF